MFFRRPDRDDKGEFEKFLVDFLKDKTFLDVILFGISIFIIFYILLYINMFIITSINDFRHYIFKLFKVTY